jgi:ABC-type arginine transport system ATPase subunit
MKEIYKKIKIVKIDYKKWPKVDIFKAIIKMPCRKIGAN